MCLLQKGIGFVNLVDRTNFVQRQTYNSRLLSKCLQNRLSDPPYGIGDKFKSSRFVKTLGCFDKPQVSFINKVGKCKPLVLILFGNRNYKTKICFSKFFQSNLITCFDTLRQFNLHFGGYQVNFSYFLKIFI